MKQIIKCLLLLLFTIVLVACSSDDDQANDTKELLVVKANKSEVSIGEPIIFSAFNKSKKEVKDVEFYVDGNKISQQHRFDKKGMFYVVAKKKGYTNSNPIDIAVMDADGEVVLNKIKMTVDKSTISIGDKVTFEVKIDGKVATSGYKIKYYQGDAIESNTLVLEKAGKYKFVATKDDYATSEIIEINVKLKSTVTPQTFTINGTKYDIIVGAMTLSKNDQNVPILYHDVQGPYYVFHFRVSESLQKYLQCEVRVRIPRNYTEFVFPHQADPRDVSLVGAELFEGNESVFKIDNTKVDPKSTVKFGKTMIDGKNDVVLELRAIDYSVEASFTGSFHFLGY